jgi:hypothetical protein
MARREQLTDDEFEALLRSFASKLPQSDGERFLNGNPTPEERRAFTRALREAEREASRNRGDGEWSGDIDDWPGCWV